MEKQKRQYSLGAHTHGLSAKDLLYGISISIYNFYHSAIINQIRSVHNRWIDTASEDEWNSLKWVQKRFLQISGYQGN